jgi:hypothetical protein
LDVVIRASQFYPRRIHCGWLRVEVETQEEKTSPSCGLERLESEYSPLSTCPLFRSITLYPPPSNTGLIPRSLPLIIACSYPSFHVPPDSSRSIHYGCSTSPHLCSGRPDRATGVAVWSDAFLPFNPSTQGSQLTFPLLTSIPPPLPHSHSHGPPLSTCAITAASTWTCTATAVSCITTIRRTWTIRCTSESPTNSSSTEPIYPYTSIKET